MEFLDHYFIFIDLIFFQAVRAYQSPLIPYDVENLYLVLIYEQSTNDLSGVSALQDTLTTSIDPRPNWQLGDYTEQDGLTGESRSVFWISKT